MNSGCRWLRHVLTGFAVAPLLMAGCSVLPEAETLQVYSLPQVPGTETPATPAPSGQEWSLKVQTPYSNQILNSNRIVVRPDHRELSVYKGARWSDPAPVMLRDRLVDALRTRLPATVFGNGSVSVSTDLELGGDLNSFQVDYQTGAPMVHIQLDAFLVKTDSSQVVASRRFSVQEAVNGKEVPEVVSAFGRAADTLSDELAAWVRQHGPDTNQ